MKGLLVILGGGESGTGAALLGKKLGYPVFLSDSGILPEKYKKILMEEGLPFEEGGHSEDRILQAELVVKSPGIPDTHPLVAALRQGGKEVISEIEWAGRHTDAAMYCITGSNGKTTTTLLLYHLLKEAGMDVGLAGNVGHSLAAQVAENAHAAYVVELSSFQLDGMTQFRCDTAILTNITPDHLDRYGGEFSRYRDSKFRILNNMRPEDLFIYGKDCEVVRDWVATHEVIPEKAFFTIEADPSAAAVMEGDKLVVRRQGRTFVISKGELSLQGRHNMYNAMAAVLAAMKAGVGDEALCRGLRSFPQVPHRLEKVAVCKGISWINDSKATNVDSAWYALESVREPVIWIAGGVDKGNDYSVLYELVREKVKLLICMGTDNSKLVAAFSGICEVADIHSLDETLSLAANRAMAGDTVLLSPCCASFDLFRNYEERGDLFRSGVFRITGPMGCSGKDVPDPGV